MIPSRAHAAEQPSAEEQAAQEAPLLASPSPRYAESRTRDVCWSTQPPCLVHFCVVSCGCASGVPICWAAAKKGSAIRRARDVLDIAMADNNFWRFKALKKTDKMMCCFLVPY